MTEAASPTIPTGHEVLQVRHYEAGPPEGLELVREKNIKYKFSVSEGHFIKNMSIMWIPILNFAV